jgi:hypothetical protein
LKAQDEKKGEKEMQMEIQPGKGRRVAGMALIFLGTHMLVGSAGTKFAHAPKVVNGLGAMGFDGGRLTLIAVLELLSAVLYAVPASRAVGLLMVSAYLGGAIATHIQHGQLPLPPAIVLAIVWLGSWLRCPETLWSLTAQDRQAEVHSNASVSRG